MSADVDPPAGPPPGLSEDGTAKKTRGATSMISFSDNTASSAGRAKYKTAVGAPSSAQADMSRRNTSRRSEVVFLPPLDPNVPAEKRHTVARRSMAPTNGGSILVDDLDFAKLDRMATPTIVLL